METNETPTKRSVLSRIWAVAWRLAVLVLLFIGARTVVYRMRFKIQHRSATPDYYSWSVPLSRAYRNGSKVYLVNTETGKRVTGDWAWISDAPSGGDSLAVFCKASGWLGRKQRRGYFDARSGEVVIRPRYDHAWVFSEGLGAVTDERGRVGFIGSDGRYAIMPQFRYVKDDDYLFHDGYCIVSPMAYGSSGPVKYGLIDRDGRWALAPGYDQITRCEEGVYILREGGRYGLMDKELDWLLEPVYDDMYLFSPGDRTVCVQKGPVKQVVTFEGEVVEPFVIDTVGPLYYEAEGGSGEDYSDDMTCLSDYLWFRVGPGRGVLEKTSGRVILPAVFDDVDMASGSIFECSIRSSHSYATVLYDLDGRPLGEKLSEETLETINKMNSENDED